nr:ferrous iron transport protein A [Clostridia bacterium]
MTLFDVEEGRKYTIVAVDTKDDELEAFLFSLGCYDGEPITVIRRLRSGCIVSIKDARYSIDTALARAITVK